jgi:hypothetical protein
VIIQNINDAKLLFLVKKDLQVLEEDVSSGLMSDEVPEERWSRYTLLQGTIPNLIGIAQVPLGMDVDDAFPLFHAANFGKGDKDALAEAICDGGLLMAESNFEPRSLLAYRLDDPNYWYGREETLKYLGVIDFRRAC